MAVASVRPLPPTHNIKGASESFFSSPCEPPKLHQNKKNMEEKIPNVQQQKLLKDKTKKIPVFDEEQESNCWTLEKPSPVVIRSKSKTTKQILEL